MFFYDLSPAPVPLLRSFSAWSISESWIGTSASASLPCFGGYRLFSIGWCHIRLGEWVIFDDRDFLRDEFLDISEVSDIVVVTERYRDSASPSSSGPTDTVDISFRDIRDIVIDHILECIDIDPTRRDISRDEDASGLFFEIGERTLSIILRFIPMNGFCNNSPSDEEFHHLIRSVLGSCENEHVLDFRVFEQVDDEAVFTAFIDMVDILTDGFGSGRDRRNFNFLWIAEDRPRECLDLRCHGRREEECLAFDRDNLEELLDIVDESHIEHPIGLIEDEYLDVRERNIPLIHEVEESSRSRDEDVDPLSESFGLISLLHPAKYHGLMESGVSSIRPETLLNLDREFASRSDDEGLDFSLSLIWVFLGIQELEDGDRKSRRLPGPGLGTSEEVATREDRRNSRRLDGCRSGVSFVFNSSEYRFYDGEVRK